MENHPNQEVTGDPHIYESDLMEEETEAVSGDLSEQTETTESIGEDLTEMETDTGLQLAEEAAGRTLTSPHTSSSMSTGLHSSLPSTPGPIRVRVHKRSYIRRMKGEVPAEIAGLPEGEDDEEEEEEEVDKPDPEEAEAAQLAINQRSTGQRPFQLQWLYQFKWLRYDEENNRMFCDYCTQAKRKNAFGKEKGTNNFRKSNCEEHQRSREHRLAQEYMAGLRKSHAVDVSFEEVMQGSYRAHHVVQRTGTTSAQKSTLVKSPASNQGSPDKGTLAEQVEQAEIQFHAKKAHMLLSGFMCQKNLPTALARELADIMPFMFPDSKIASAISAVSKVDY